MTDEVIRVRMVRDAKQFPESHEANVTPEGVAEFEALGWTAEVAEKKTKAPKKAKGDDTDPLDVPNDDAGGLTLRELRADIAALGLDVDTDMSPADLLALRDLTREERAKGGE